MYSDFLSAHDIMQLLRNELNIEMKSVGSNIFFKCPFHDDKNPSFNFNPRYKIFRCFSCTNFNNGHTGDFFVFWSQYKGISFCKTLEEVSQLGFFPLEKIKDEDKKVFEKKDEIFRLNGLINDVYRYNLATFFGRSVYYYLKDIRRITDETIKKFELGCTISKDQISNLFFSNEKYSYLSRFITPMWCIDDKGKMVDFFFRSQLIIPLHNAKGQVVSWVSREIKNGSKNKYIFLSGYSYYKKSDIIFNYHRVSNLSDNEVIMVEGFFDLISLDQSGIKNCIAILGVKLSRNQLELISLLKKKIVFFLDGDEAGKKATIDLIVVFSRLYLDCEVIDFSYDSDPDELVKKNEDLDSIIKKRKNPYLFVLDYYYDKWLLKENPQRIGSFIREISSIFRDIKFIHEFLIEKISFLTNWGLLEIKECFFNINFLPGFYPFFFLFQYCTKRILIHEKELIFFCMKKKFNWSFLLSIKYTFINFDLKKKYLNICSHYFSTPDPIDIHLEDKITIKKSELTIGNMLKIIEKINNLKEFRKNHDY